MQNTFDWVVKGPNKATVLTTHPQYTLVYQCAWIAVGGLIIKLLKIFGKMG